MPAPLPQLWGVLYAEPNGDGQRKSCANCRFTDEQATVCDVVDAPITPEMVCGYHIPKGELADPKLSGLDTVPGGTSCDNCRYFQGQGGGATPMTALAGASRATGTCVATEGPSGGPAEVDPMGCCARWEE